MGITSYDDTDFTVLENTEHTHHMVVCTLCSCYPRPILGLPPDWYKSKQYRSRAVIEPRKVLAEFGTVIPDDVEICVNDSTANLRYMVLPLRPKGTENFTEKQLEALVTRDVMIGSKSDSPGYHLLITNPQNLCYAEYGILNQTFAQRHRRNGLQ
jgi:nitrile hydratase